MANDKVKVFRALKNMGPYQGLNFLLEKADGEYIAIQDHDDIWFPKKIEKQVEFLEKNRDYIACGTGTFYFYESKDILILNQKPKIADFVEHTSLMFRNKGFRYKDKHYFSDNHFEKKILLKEGRIACIQEDLTIHRIKNDGSNLSYNRFKISFLHFKDFFDVFPINRISSWICLVDIFASKFLPEKIVWFIRKYITQRKKIWILANQFKKEFKIDF
jgi:glycosyltransferase involved in cell wall biosynthesis